MNSTLTADTFLTAILTGLISSVLYTMIQYLLRAVAVRLGPHTYRLKLPWWIRMVAVLIIVVSLTTAINQYFNLHSDPLVIATSTASIGMLACIWKLMQLSKIGIVDFDRQVATGLHYSASLKSVKNGIRFLGTGASKLTGENQFADAISRCQSGSGARFLLTHPDDPFLVAAAQQFGSMDLAAYKTKVRRSLQDLANLQRSRNFKIEVRFRTYSNESDIETFRLFFIDDLYCLASYNAYGQGDGRDLPQLIVKRSSSEKEHKSFYYAWSQYFECKWQAGKPWNVDEFYQAP